MATRTKPYQANIPVSPTGFSLGTASNINSSHGLHINGETGMNGHIAVKLLKRDLKKMYYIRKMSLRDMENALGISRDTISKYMRKFGLKLRSIHDARMFAIGKTTGENHYHWKGGRYNAGGYIAVYAPKHPHCSHHWTVPEHIIVAEKSIGRYLRKGEMVHHLDCNKLNNHPDNLCVTTEQIHRTLHYMLGRVGMLLMLSGKHKLVLSMISNRDVKRVIREMYIRRRKMVKT